MRKWWPLAAICLGTFMLLVDVTIVTVALPDMAEDFDTTLPNLEWVVDIYALALAALLLGVGSSADRVGRKKVYLYGLVIFTAASLVCGVAPNPGVLIAARAVQGLGAAGMFGTTIALLGMHYSGRDRGVAFAVWGAINAIAAAAGPVVGGLLTEYLNWRWIFFVNLPVCLVAVVMTLRVVREAKTNDGKRADVFGTVTFTVASGSLTFALIRAHSDGWGATLTLVMFAVAVVALALFLWVEKRHENPVLDLSLFRRPSFTGIMVSALILQGAAFAYLLFESLWMQSVLGYGPVKAGLYILPMCGAAFVVSALAGRLGPWPARTSMAAGLALIAIGSGLQTMLDAGSSGNSIVAGLVVSGMGVGLVTPSLSAAALASVPPERGGMAGGAVNTFRQLGFALGIAVFGVIFQSRIEHVLKKDGSVPNPHEVAVALSGGQAQSFLAHSSASARAGMQHLVRDSFSSGLNLMLGVSAVLAAVAAVLAFAMVRIPTTGGAEKPPQQSGGNARGQEAGADATV
ncbi:MFS transporter [Streptomyces sp. NBC_01477]|uniref:MFS transporter n=1 Tax=Streptomyces sp. NBC_01477 TaxID=2976015 RepID=UPI002E2EE278|nr:MFS transporter [Streptomyces sp. NBC_01477]